MLRKLIAKRLDAGERELGASVEYLRWILDRSLRLFFKFTKFLSFAQHRRACPANPYLVAMIVATRHYDCGPCVQIGVNMARKAGVPIEQIRAAVEGRPDDLPEELADAYRFAEAVVTMSGSEEELREKIRARYGDEGLIELAYAIACGGVFPTVKRALGYARSCSLVPVEV